jgi:uncharacterized protein (DUF1499 family)
MLPIIYIILDELSSLFLQDAAPVVRIFLFLIFITIYVISQKTFEKIYLLKKNINKLIEILYSINSKTLLINSNKYVYIKEYDLENLEFFRFADKIKRDFDFDSRLLELIKNSRIELNQVGLVHYNKFKEEQKLWG